MISSEQQHIIDFFLNLYRYQMRADRRPAEYRCLEPAQRSGAEAIYELRIKQEDGWRSRRMSIGPLAEESGSKSRCFKVIFDELLVVKLPPKPIADFEDYLRHLRREQDIAARLSPEVTCITPTVSAILRKLPDFAAQTNQSPAEFEEVCLRQLRGMPGYQRHLKIGGQFAFFMNLSQNAFLGSVIGTMHDLRNQLSEELATQGDLLDNPVRFEEVYGRDNLNVFFDLQEVLAIFESEVGTLLSERGAAEEIPVFRRRHWFLRALADRPAEPTTDGLSAELADEIDQILQSVLESHQTVVSRYRSAIRVHVFYRLLGQNRTAMAGLVANLLELLSILREKGVAMRDLKPDNVFLAGDVSVSPALLASPRDYAIGLIDFETAVDFQPPDGGVSQPMLAGTPSYATPSHLFRNDLLASLFGDLGRVLHLQDWQAVSKIGRAHV